MGTFTIRDHDLRGAIVNGKPTDNVFRVAEARPGPIKIQIIQVLEGGEILTEFLRRRGGGLHHLGIVVDTLDDFDRSVAKLSTQGIKSVMSHTRRDSSGVPYSTWAYFDTQVFGGLMLELVYYRGGPIL